MLDQARGAADRALPGYRGKIRRNAATLDSGRIGFVSQVSFSGLDIGLDRGSPVSRYAAPFCFRGGQLYRVEYTLDPMLPPMV